MSQKIATMVGALLGLLLAALDQTIVSTAGPFIQRDLAIAPSLYAWLWLPVERRFWQRVALFAVGLAGPVAALFILGDELGISVVGAVLYAVGLATVGYVSLASALLALVWLAAAAQVGAIAFGRYAPYADGVEPPPPGLFRSALRRVS